MTFGVCFVTAFVTGLISHYVQHPVGWFHWPTRPAGLYRVTQGIHVATGIATGPLLLAKLWAVAPRLVRPPPVLAARTGSPVSVNAQILFVDLDFNIFVDLWIDEQGSKRRMTSGCLIEWRDPDQAVHAGFRRQQSIRIFAFNLKSHAFYSRFFARLIIDNLGLKFPPFSPLQVHT